MDAKPKLSLVDLTDREYYEMTSWTHDWLTSRVEKILLSSPSGYCNINDEIGRLLKGLKPELTTELANMEEGHRNKNRYRNLKLICPNDGVGYEDVSSLFDEVHKRHEGNVDEINIEIEQARYPRNYLTWNRNYKAVGIVKLKLYPKLGLLAMHENGIKRVGRFINYLKRLGPDEAKKLIENYEEFKTEIEAEIKKLPAPLQDQKRLPFVED